jgi:hypothetical protein
VNSYLLELVNQKQNLTDQDTAPWHSEPPSYRSNGTIMSMAVIYFHLRAAIGRLAISTATRGAADLKSSVVATAAAPWHQKMSTSPGYTDRGGTSPLEAGLTLLPEP